MHRTAMTIDDVCWGQGTELLVVILQSKSDLLEVVGTLCARSSRTRSNGWQQKSNQNGEAGDEYQYPND